MCSGVLGVSGVYDIVEGQKGDQGGPKNGQNSTWVKPDIIKITVVWSPSDPEAARVSHDNPRAQTCTFEGPGLQKHH